MITYGESIKVDFQFFHAPAGTIYHRIEGTYEMNVCDCCGRNRSCDFYESDDGSTLMDLCRRCKKKHAEVVEDD